MIIRGNTVEALVIQRALEAVTSRVGELKVRVETTLACLRDLDPGDVWQPNGDEGSFLLAAMSRLTSDDDVFVECIRDVTTALSRIAQPSFVDQYRAGLVSVPRLALVQSADPQLA